jgi:uncharacterized repeat protein (TIGR01451 family)
MKRDIHTNSPSTRTTTQDILLMKRRGRLAALFVLLALAALVGGASLSSATSNRPSPVPVKGPDVSSEEKSLQVFADSDLFNNTLLAPESKTTCEEQLKIAKAPSKSKGKSGVRSKVSTPSRSRAAKNTSRSANSAATAQMQSAQGAENRITKHRNSLGQTVYSISPAGSDISPPLSDLASLAPEQGVSNERPELPFPAWRVPRSNQPDPVTQVAPSGQSSVNFPLLAAPTTGFNFLGMIGGGSYPPDNNGSVGNDQYVETVNTTYQVWSLNRGTSTATSLVGPSSINTLWSGFVGGNCSSRNDGDPIVVYDKVANRWLISQFTSAASGGSYYQCVAISTTANAAGTYARYAFAVPNGNFGDYPHFGVWTDAYYMMAHGFTAASGGSYTGGIFAAMDRTKMLAGDPTATWQVIIDPVEGGQMPADLDGFAPPPGGAPGIFTSVHSDGMYLYRMKVDFTTPANTARTLQGVMPVAASTGACASAGGNCIPQPGSTATVDSLGDRLMFRLAYRNFIDHESLVVSHSVDPGITGLVSGVRWYDFRISGQPDAVCSAYPCTYQQGTVADVANGRSRWMPSISMDGAENIIVGYSTTGKTSGSDNHSIRYTGRAKGDPLGVMTAPETIIFTGTRNISNTQTSPGRWGDYTSTSIDPADDCTFWHVNEYYLSGGSTGSGNANWKTRIASIRFPAGTGAGQCQAGTCTTRPSSAPVIGSASVGGPNQIMVTWTGISPTPGSYAIERAIGALGSEGLYQPLAFVAGATNFFVDNTVQGGLTYTYRVVAATDSAGKCQALVRSGGASATATGNCNLKPVFGGVTSASSGTDSSCGVTLNWSPATSSCPLTPNMRYNIFRGTVPDFVPSAANRIAMCVTGPSSYVDTNNLSGGSTYYYVVRAEDDSTVNGGECGGGNEEANNVVVAGTPYGPGVQATPGTWTDGGGDGTAFLQLNPGGGGNTADQAWRFVKTANDAGANHTPGGAYAYRTAGPAASPTYSSNECSVAQTPILTAGSATINLTYWERHQLEKGWDGIAIEYSRNGGAWTDVPAPNNLTGSGCLVSDITTDYATLGCTGAPPANACAYAATKSVITGPVGSGTSCTNWVTATTPSAYGRRCHLLTGLTPGDTIQFRWRMISDPAAEFAGFYLDDIGVTNILLPQSCTTNQGPPTSTTADPATGTFGGTVNLSATLTDGSNPLSGKSVSFTLNGNSVGSANTNGSGVATLNSVSLSGSNAGSYPTGVGASFAGGGGYSASNGTAALTVNPADQTITFNALSDKTYGDADFNVSATSSSGLTVSFSAAGNCTVSGSTVHITGGGSCTITASQGGNGNYNAAPNVDRSFNIAQAATTTTVTVSNAVYDGNPHGGTATVTGPAGLNQSVTVSYSGRNATVYGPSNTAPTGAGDYTASANYAGDANYQASSDSKDYQITKANQTITFGALSDKTYGDADFNVSATASSGLTVSFAALGNCTVSGSTVHITGAGSCTITASQAGDTNYNAAADVPQSFNIAKATATVTLSDLSHTYNGSPQGATVTTTPNGLSVTVTYDGSATVPTNAGSYAVVATVNDANYEGSASDTLVIAKANATINVSGFTGDYDGNSHGATGTATGVQSEDLSSLFDFGATYTNVPGGNAHWTFNAGNTNTNYNSTSGDVAITINKATPTINWSNPADIIYGTALSGTQLNATANTAGSYVYTPASGTVLSSGNGQNLHVAFTPTDTTNYNGATKDVSLNVLTAVLNISMTADRNPAPVGSNFNYKPVITNTGNAAATNVVLTDVLPTLVTFTAASTSQGTCSYNTTTRTVTCNLGTVAVGATVNVQITVKPRDEGTLNDTASITGGQWDPATGNSSASVNGLPAVKLVDLSVSKTDSVDPIFVGDNTTYTMVVKNSNTAINATGVVLTDNLPSGMSFVSATTSQGSLVTPPVGSTGIVTANIGTMAPNATVTVTVTVKGETAGVQTNTASVSANETDSNSANNTANQSTTVKAVVVVGLQKVLLAKQVLTGGCENTTGNVYLTGPAPAGGVTVALSSNISGVTVPASVDIPAGTMVSPNFPVTTNPVTAKQVGLVTATSGPNSVSRGITINVGNGTCP